MKRFFIFLNFICLGIILSLVKTKADSVIPGDDPRFAPQIGQGIVSSQLSTRGSCILADEVKTTSGDPRSHKASLKVLEIHSKKDLKNALNVSASASLKFGLYGSGGASVNYTNSVDLNSNYEYILIHVKILGQVETLAQAVFSSAAQELLKTHPEDFYAYCGNEFVYGRQKGAEFFALLEFISLSEEQKKSLVANANVDLTLGSLSGSVNRTVQSLKTSSVNKVYMEYIGGNQAFPKLETISIKEFAQSFPQLVNSLTNGLVTTQLLTRKYYGVEPFHLKIPTFDIEENHEIITLLASEMESTKEKLDLLEDYFRNPRLYLPAKASLKTRWGEVKTQLKNRLKTIKQLAKICFKGDQECQEPEWEEISFPLPLKLTPWSEKNSSPIQTSNGSPWGEWAQAVFCPQGMYAYGFNTKVEAPGDENGGDNEYDNDNDYDYESNDESFDDSALNLIALYCRYPESSALFKESGLISPDDQSENVIVPNLFGAGLWGEWGKKNLCRSQDFLTGFNLKVQQYCGYDCEDTAANDLYMMCEDHKKQRPYKILASNGAPWGEWGSETYCPQGQAICGLKTRIESNQGDKDDTALNDVIFYCCPLPH